MRFGTGTNVTESAETSASWIDRTLKSACNMAAPRVGKPKHRRNAYWWSPQIAELRRTCIKTKRKLTEFNSQHRNGSSSLTEESVQMIRRELNHLYKETRKRLRNTNKKAKLESWMEFLASVEADSWGRPYLLVLRRLRRSRLGLTESLEENMLCALMDSLFPVRGGRNWTGGWRMHI